MKASELVKKSQSLESIYKSIENANQNGEFKCFIPHFFYVEESVKLKLLQDGFKISVGDWDGMIKNALIIEW